MSPSSGLLPIGDTSRTHRRETTLVPNVCFSNTLRTTWSRRWIHHNQGVDCGSQREGIENVDVIVFLFGPRVSKVQKMEGKQCTVGREINCSGEVM